MKLFNYLREKNLTQLMRQNQIVLVLIIVVVFALGAFSSYFYWQSKINKTATQTNSYLAFISEVYDKIQKNYWNKISDENLSNLFRLAAEKLTSRPQVLKTNDKSGVIKLTQKTIAKMPLAKKKEFVINMSDLVLANLEPFNRSRLFTTKKQQALRNTVQNIDPGTDLYQVLGVAKDASDQEIKKAYEAKKKEIAQLNDPQAQEKLAQINRAFEALSNKERRQIYDATKIEPTVIAKILRPNIVYIKLTKVSPQSFEEFKKEASRIPEDEKLNTLILDLRGNVGGAIDILPYFLGPFIGQNQYAYEFFHQGEYTPFKTKTGWLPSLVKYKKVVVLIDGNTQSSAEVMAAVLKKYNVGILVGTPTKGWGTIEKVFPLENQIEENETYSIFLVHSLTLRDDNQPIEGRGVDPVINIKDPNWEAQLLAYFNFPALVEEVKKLWFQNP